MIRSAASKRDTMVDSKALLRLAFGAAFFLLFAEIGYVFWRETSIGLEQATPALMEGGGAVGADFIRIALGPLLLGGAMAIFVFFAPLFLIGASLVRIFLAPFTKASEIVFSIVFLPLSRTIAIALCAMLEFFRRWRDAFLAWFSVRPSPQPHTLDAVFSAGEPRRYVAALTGNFEKVVFKALGPRFFSRDVFHVASMRVVRGLA